ncbi:MAG: hypothetical protein LBH44_11315 [Treponema sp.]|jgi:hypothetical protein|nr:hypothetical protein [Treponema sp.]
MGNIDIEASYNKYAPMIFRRCQSMLSKGCGKAAFLEIGHDQKMYQAVSIERQNVEKTDGIFVICRELCAIPIDHNFL